VVNPVYNSCFVVPDESHQETHIYVFDSPNSAMANEMGMVVRGDNFRDVPSEPYEPPPIDDSTLPQPAIRDISIGDPSAGGLLSMCRRQYPN